MSKHAAVGTVALVLLGSLVSARETERVLPNSNEIQSISIRFDHRLLPIRGDRLRRYDFALDTSELKRLFEEFVN